MLIGRYCNVKSDSIVPLLRPLPHFKAIKWFIPNLDGSILQIHDASLLLYFPKCQENITVVPCLNFLSNYTRLETNQLERTNWKYNGNFVKLDEHSMQNFDDMKEHYNGVIMSAMASQIASHTIVYSAVYSCADQRKHQSSASLSFVRGIPAQMASNMENVPIW